MEPIQGKPLAVERISAASFGQQHLARYRPVIVTDALSDWKALGVWSPEYLASALKMRRVQVAISSRDRFDFRPQRGAAVDTREFELENMDFPSAVARMSRPGNEHLYVMQRSIPDQFPELLPDIKTPSWIRNQKLTINLWCGGANNVTPLHHDQPNNFYAQLYGRKRFTIFDPMETDFLYPYPVETEVGHISYVDVEKPDLIKYPKFRRARSYEFTIETGELLYLPAFWWHHVRSLETAISVSFWWPADFQQRLLPNALRGLIRFYQEDRLMGIKRDLAQAGMDFMSAAGLLQSMDRNWAAVLLAGAALEEFVRKLAQARGIVQMHGNKFRPLREVSADLHAAGVLSTAESQKVGGWDEMITRALTGDSNAFTGVAVASLLREIRSFIERPLR